MLVLSIFYSGV